jgi:uncharacterized protein DUF6510
MDALDGNAIAGRLVDAFGTEMTTASGICASCGAEGPLGELVVYLRAPGAVGRCPSCSAVLIVLVTRQDIVCVDLRGLAALDATP